MSISPHSYLVFMDMYHPHNSISKSVDVYIVLETQDIHGSQHQSNPINK